MHWPTYYLKGPRVQCRSVASTAVRGEGGLKGFVLLHFFHVFSVSIVTHHDVLSPSISPPSHPSRYLRPPLFSLFLAVTQFRGHIEALVSCPPSTYGSWIAFLSRARERRLHAAFSSLVNSRLIVPAHATKAFSASGSFLFSPIKRQNLTTAGFELRVPMLVAVVAFEAKH